MSSRTVIPQLSTCVVLFFSYSAAWAGGVYLEPREFILQSFPDSSPPVQYLNLDKPLITAAKRILGYQPRGQSLRYWQDEERTAWVLEDQGQYQPMTVGIVIDQSQIEVLRVLIHRETQGWQVKQNFFTERFSGASLRPDKQLSQRIDALSGATYSSRSIVDLSRWALFLTDYLDE